MSPRLHDLYLFDNALEALPSTLTQLVDLKSLDLRGNVQLPEQFRTSTYTAASTQEVLTRIGAHYALVEDRHRRCGRVAILLIALRRLHRSRYVVLIDIAVMRMIAVQVWSLRNVW